MNVLFLMFNFEDANNTVSMYNSLVDVFVARGHNVSVVAFEKAGKPTGIYREGLSDVLRVKTLPLLGVGPFRKGLGNIIVPFQYGLAIRKYLKDFRFDLIITPTPPITLFRIAYSLKKRNRTKLYLILRDIFPQNAVDIGYLSKNNPIYHYFRWIEKRLYQISDLIGCMTEGNRSYILRNNPGIDPAKVHVLPNWNRIQVYETGVSEDLLDKYGLAGKFIVIFGGNLGVSQKVDNVVELAKVHASKRDVVFVVVGKGTHKTYLQHLIDREGLKNIRLIDYMPRADYEKLVSKSEIGLISLNEKFTIPNIPSRTLSYYNMRKPVFAITDPNTDYHEMLKQDNSGFCCLYGDYACYRKRFDQLYNDQKLRMQMGENGFIALRDKYNPENSYKIIMNAVTSSVKS